MVWLLHTVVLAVASGGGCAGCTRVLRGGRPRAGGDVASSHLLLCSIQQITSSCGASDFLGL